MVTLFSFILLLVTSEISLYRFWFFRDLEEHLEANVIADDKSLSSFNFSPAIMISTRLSIDIHVPASAHALIRRSSYFLKTPLSLPLMPMRRSNVSKTWSNSPIWKKHNVLFQYKNQSLAISVLWITIFTSLPRLLHKVYIKLTYTEI